ncbi:MAG: DUF2206 domain-containing protein [Desulfobacula sp.]|nr:DUF2206 domain-containing protein [Desulfobacula sp.]
MNVKLKIFPIVFAIQFAILGAIGLDLIGIQIPIIRQFFGFIYLTFIPGTLIIIILKLNKLGNIERLMYTVGLSISFLMFIGASLNIIYPFFGISHPISVIPLIVSLSVATMILCILIFIREKNFSAYIIEIKDILFPQVLFLCLLPLLSVIGTYFVNFYQTNIILMFLIIAIALIVVLIGFDIFIPKNLYPLAVIIIAISLLLHNSTISMYLWGWDIHAEYYWANTTILKSLWDSTTPSNVNSMLSITMLAPIFSNITGMSLTWVFKIFYPLIFSLVPLGLYRIYQKQTNDKIAFLSVFLFMSFYSFFTTMLQLARQQIAEIFLILIVLLIIDTNMNRLKQTILVIIFMFSLGVSHYGLSYIVLFLLIATYFSYCFEGRYKNMKLTSNITATLVLLYIVFVITWYMNISNSSSFNSFVLIGDHIITSIVTDFLQP